MIELPFFSWDLVRSVIQNFTIIATLVLLYNFIPDTVRSRSKPAFSAWVGLIFGIAAAISIPSLWQASGGLVLGFNVILIPLAGSIGGPVSAVLVVILLVIGNAVTGGTLSSWDLITLVCGILLGALLYQGRSWSWFPRSPSARLLLLGAGVALIVSIPPVLSPFLQGTPAPGTVPPAGILPFILISCGGTVLLGSIILFIDRKKQAEQELLEHKVHLETLVAERTAELRQANSLQIATIESTADGIVVVDREGIIRAYNQKARAILNLPGRLPRAGGEYGAFTAILGSLLPEPRGFLDAIGQLPESAEQIVTTVRFRSGRIYELYVHPQLVGDHSLGRVWSLHDITDQRLAEEAITAANNKLVLLSTLTRHDILNQITALSVSLELLGEADRDPGTTARVRAMRKTLEVIQLQLEFSRDYQDLGLQKPGWQGVDGSFRQAAASFEGKNITFSCDTGPVGIYADPMIGQAFSNLIDNSLRHGERVSAIRLSARMEDPDLVLVYEDNGTGVPPEEKERIFLRGFGKHTGLGMFLIKEILSITGITIRETGIYGKGVRFEIRVPAGKYRLTS
jgi:signal transduction histidine kinase